MSASGRNDFRCPICKKSFEDCPHSYADIAIKRDEARIRTIVRDELKKAGLLTETEVRCNCTDRGNRLKKANSHEKDCPVYLRWSFKE